MTKKCKRIFEDLDKYISYFEENNKPKPSMIPITQLQKDILIKEIGKEGSKVHRGIPLKVIV
jgi:hypothetical protein